MNTTSSISAIENADVTGLDRKLTPTPGSSASNHVTVPVTRNKWLATGLIALICFMTAAVVIKAAGMMADISSVMNDTYNLLSS